MSTGNLHGNLQRLLREAKSIKYPSEIDEVGLRLGDPVAFLPLISFALTKFSRHVARYIVRSGFELQGKTDQRFVESSFKLFRDVLNVRTVLTPSQFFDQGYAERKLLLLCDVIEVCKKCHNEEVRQERLAALKATRQEQASTRLTGTRRSPVVKVVRNGDVEITHSLTPQHLNNATDGAQSVFKVRQTVARSRSPSPEPGARPGGPAGKPTLPSRRSPTAAQARGPGRAGTDPLELTLRPEGRSSALGRQPTPSLLVRGPAAAATQPPIHAWFLNPAFDEASDGGLSMGIGLGQGGGRPDSSAWWATGPGASSQQPLVAAAPTGPHAAPWAIGSPNTAGRGVPSPSGQSAPSAPGGHGYQPAWSHQAAAPSRTLPPQMRQQPTAPNRFQPHPGAVTSTAGIGGPAKPNVSAAGGGASPRPGTGVLDEWSFSKYFGPGKGPQKLRAGAGRSSEGVEGPAEESDKDEVASLGGEGFGAGAGSEPVDAEDTERDGPAPDQDRERQRAGASGRGLATDGSRAAHSAAVGSREVQPAGERMEPVQQGQGAWQFATSGASIWPEREHSGALAAAGSDSGRGAGVAGTPAPPGSAAATDELASQLARLEQETQRQLGEMQDKLAAAQEQLEQNRLEAQQTRDVLQARITVLEGRVRFLECEVELCAKRPDSGDQGPVALGSSEQQRGPSPSRSPVDNNGRSLWRDDAAASQPAAGRGSPGRWGTGAAQTETAAGRTSIDPQMAAPLASGHGLSHRHDYETAEAESRRSYDLYATSGPQQIFAGTYQHGLPDQAQFRVSASNGRAEDRSAWREGDQQIQAPGWGSGAAHPSTAPRLPGSFSPMPQPAFAFQPSRLMQQVATVTAGQQQHATGHTPSQHMRAYGGSLDSAIPARGISSSSDANGVPAQAAAAGSWDRGPISSGTGGATRGSLDSRLTLSLQGDAAHSEAGGAVPGWRGGAAAAARPGALTGGSILDTVYSAAASEPSGTQQWQPAGPTHPAAQPPSRMDTGLLRTSAAQGTDPPHRHLGEGHGGERGLARGQDAVAPLSTTGTAASAGPGGSVPGGGGQRSTEDLISSLYMRYTEAQDFLQTIRKR